MNFIFFKYTGVPTEIITGEGISNFKLSYFFTVMLPPMFLFVFLSITKA